MQGACLTRRLAQRLKVSLPDFARGLGFENDVEAAFSDAGGERGQRLADAWRVAAPDERDGPGGGEGKDAVILEQHHRAGGEFLKLAREKAALLKLDMDMLKRPVNVGFSGGEKKRAEMVQMGILDPAFAVLDETDSGLDIDAIRVVAEGANRLRRADRSMLVITHYQRLLDYIVPDFVHVMHDGRIVKSGDKSLALELEAKGYAQFQGEAA